MCDQCTMVIQLRAIIARADARIAELKRECVQWRDELRIYRETESKQIAELEQSVTVRDTEVARLETDLELARIGARRYETARRMNVPMWKDALKLNLSTGKPFDEIIDELRPFMFPQDAARAGNGESGDASPVLDAQYLKSRLAKDLEIIRNNQLPTRR